MRTAHIDYLWIDGFDTPTIRSKTKIQPLKNTDDESFELEIETEHLNKRKYYFETQCFFQSFSGNSCII